jgi:O-methyltransferase
LHAAISHFALTEAREYQRKTLAAGREDMPQTRAKLAASLFPKHVPFIDKVNHNALVSDWIKSNKDKVQVLPDRFDLYSYLNKNVLHNDAIDYLEFGVYRGDSIRRWSTINTHPNSRFFGFDSFEGLPEGWTNKHGEGAFDVSGNIPQIDDPRVSFVKGWFQHTLRPMLANFQPRSRLVIHNDSDLYSSTLYVLATLDQLIVPDTVIVFDEFCVALHEFRAFFDYQRAFMRSATPLAMTEDFATQAAFVFD